MSPTTLLWLIAGCLMLQPLSTDLYLASLPHLASDFGVTPAAVQQTLSLFVIGFGVAQLISGPLSDRFGRRPVLLGGLGVYIASSLACALAPSLDLLIAARFVQAIGCCTAAVVARALIRDAFTPTEGAKVMAKASSLLSLAPIFGPILGGYLQVGFGWRAAFFFHSFFCIVLAGAAWRLLEETNLHRNPDAIRLRNLIAVYRRIASADFFWAYTLPGALSYAAIFSFISGSSFVLINVLGVPTEFYGYCFAFGVSGYLIGTLVCRRLLARIGLARTLTAGTHAFAVLRPAIRGAGIGRHRALVGGRRLPVPDDGRARHQLSLRPDRRGGALSPRSRCGGRPARLHHHVSPRWSPAPGSA